MGMFGYPQSHSYTLNLPLKVMVLYCHWFIQSLIQKCDHLEDWRNSKSESSYSMMQWLRAPPPEMCFPFRLRCLCAAHAANFPPAPVHLLHQGPGSAPEPGAPCISSTWGRAPPVPGPGLANFSASAEDVFWNMISIVGAVQSLSMRDIGKFSWFSYNSVYDRIHFHSQWHVRISSRWVTSTGTRDKHRHTSWRNLNKLSDFLLYFFSFLICKWEWVGQGIAFIFMELLWGHVV